MELITKLGDGSLLRGLAVLPFAISGFYLLFRGFVANIDHLSDTHPKATGVQASLYFLGLVLSYLAAFLAIKNLF